MKSLYKILFLLTLSSLNAQLVEDTANEAIHFDNAFFLQRTFESENAWNRGMIGQSIIWDKSSKLWSVNRALKNNSDFAMIRFMNGGDMGFFARETQGSNNYTITNDNISNFLRMKIHSEGNVEIVKNLGVGANADDNYRLHVEMPNPNHIRLTNTNPSEGNGTIAFHNSTSLVSRLHLSSGGTFRFQTYDGTDFTSVFNVFGNGDTEVTGKLGINSAVSNDHSLRIAKGNQKIIDLYQTGSGSASISLTHPEGEVSRIQLGSNGDFNFQRFENGAWENSLRVNSIGHVGIASTASSNYALQVGGSIRSHEIKVEIFNGPDYVFEEAYNLRTLEETEAYIKANKHLPEIPSAKEMEANGVQLGEMNMLLLKKIEELTLHIIQQQKLIEAQEQLISEQKAINKKIIERLEKLER